MTLVAYLEHVTDKLMIDLIAVNSFDVDGTSAYTTRMELHSRGRSREEAAVSFKSVRG